MAAAMRAVGAVHAERHMKRPDGTQEEWVLTLGPPPVQQYLAAAATPSPQASPSWETETTGDPATIAIARKRQHYFDLLNQQLTDAELELLPDPFN